MREKQRQQPAQTVTQIFTVFMFAVYAGLAAVLLTGFWPEDLPRSNRIFLAAAILLYLAYRIGRMIRKKRHGPQP